MNKDMSQAANKKETKTFVGFDKSFQEKIIQALLIDRVWASQMAEVVHIDFFEYNHIKKIAASYFTYHKKYKEFPSVEMLAHILADELRGTQDAILKDQIKGLLEKTEVNPDLADLGYVKDKSLDFCRRAGLQKALEESVDLIETEKYEKVVEVIKTAINAGNEHNAGLDLTDDIDARYSETFRKTTPTGIPELDKREILNGGLGGGEIGVVVAMSGCHKKGTKILMYDGTLKNVEDLTPGESLMGPDSKPRLIQKLVRGREKMYDIIPVKGEVFTVNENHILSLKNSTTGKIVNISVKEYLNSTNNFFKNTHKLYRSNQIIFPKTQESLPIDPYMLGVMIGDGWISEKRVEITTADQEIVNEIYDFAKKQNLGVSKHLKKNNKASGYYFTAKGKHENNLRNKLKDLNLLNSVSGNKFIPHVYKIASIEDRKQLLAGLLDTDGYMGHNSYSLITKSKTLAEDVAYIARSLGLAAYITTKTKSCQNMFSGIYHSVSISGETNKIPCKLPRKQASNRKQIKNVLNTGFSLVESQVDDFYGFTVNEDHLYVMGDYTVTHNCGKSHLLTHFGATALLHGKNVLHYTYELSERATGIRYDSHLLGIDSLDLYDRREDVKRYYKENGENLGRLKIKYYPTGTATVNTIRGHIDKLSAENFRPDLVLIDYAGIMRSTERYELLRLELKKVFEELRGFAAEINVPIWTAAQSNKEGNNSEVIDMTNMAEAYAQAHVADFILGLSRKSMNKSTGYGNIFVAKNRNGMDGIKFDIHLNTAQSRLRVLSPEEVSEMYDKSSYAITEQTGANSDVIRMKIRNFMKTH